MNPCEVVTNLSTRAFKSALRPTQKQEAYLKQAVEVSRWLYNSALVDANTAYAAFKGFTVVESQSVGPGWISKAKKIRLLWGREVVVGGAKVRVENLPAEPFVFQG